MGIIHSLLNSDINISMFIFITLVVCYTISSAIILHCNKINKKNTLYQLGGIMFFMVVVFVLHKLSIQYSIIDLVVYNISLPIIACLNYLTGCIFIVSTYLIVRIYLIEYHGYKDSLLNFVFNLEIKIIERKTMNLMEFLVIYFLSMWNLFFITVGVFKLIVKIYI